MTANELEQAFEQVGESLTRQTTIVVAGSAMFLLEGSLPREAGDCDVAKIDPPEQKEELDTAALAAARAGSLEPGWLNDHMTAFEDFDRFPYGWQARTTLHGNFGNLEVRCMSRRDAIALKAVTLQERGDRNGHEPDLTDLEAVNATEEELTFAIDYLLQDDHETDYSRAAGALINMREKLRDRRNDQEDSG